MASELFSVNTVAIVGGGFCGTLTAVNLARSSTDRLRITLINAHYPLGRGIAYGTRRAEHLLNVVARNMSAFPDLPSHFVEWLRNRADFAEFALADLREQFVPRRVYGDYLQDLLFWQAQPLGGTSRVQIEMMDDEVIDVALASRGGKVIVKNGSPVEADRVLLATGNLTPHDMIPAGPVREHPAYCANPWSRWYDQLPDSREDVLLVGTGLTMIDVFLTLQTLGWSGTIHAVSRTGLLPLPHFKGSDYPLFPPDDVDTMGLHSLAALMEEHCARLRADGMNPALVVDKLRPFTQRIWRNFSVPEKQEFSRDYRTRWNVVRHRIPPTVAGQIETAQKENRLRILKGRIRDARAAGDKIAVTVDPGKGQTTQDLNVGFLVNCTGPRESLADAPADLFRNLLERGLVRPDELDMGIEVTPDFAVVDQHGQPSDWLFAIGPLLKGTLWETTAVPELRAQTHQVAQALLARVQAHHPDWVQETPANLVEYYI
jgi:uncharacterized NAD(P)/FAD-binding protein YdhS